MDIALLVLAALALFVTATSIVVMLFLLVQAVRDMRDIRTMAQISFGKIAGIEKLALSTHTLLLQDTMGGSPVPPPGPGPNPNWEPMGISQEDGNFVTEDGAHSATSFEDLIKKITNDPRYRVARPEDIERLRKQFEDYGNEFGDQPDEFTDPTIDGDEWKDGS